MILDLPNLDQFGVEYGNTVQEFLKRKEDWRSHLPQGNLGMP